MNKFQSLTSDTYIKEKIKYCTSLLKTETLTQTHDLCLEYITNHTYIDRGIENLWLLTYLFIISEVMTS